MRRSGPDESGNLHTRPFETAAPFIGKMRPAAPEGSLRSPFGRKEGFVVAHRARHATGLNKGKGRPRMEPPFPISIQFRP